MADKQNWLERVRAGQSFEMIDWDFLDAVFKGQNRAKDYNAVAIGEFERRTAMLGELFGKVGEGVVVQSPVSVDVGFNVEIGDRSFINMNCTLLDTYPIRIGHDVQIGPNCAFYPVGHPVRSSERHITNAEGEPRSVTTGAAITIEDGVWLGGNVIILPGVTIGARSTVGAGSVVTKSIPPDVFAAGNPCRVIKQLN
ncbi:MAG: sugar O-acetyltransferase [Devosia sp.]